MTPRDQQPDAAMDAAITWQIRLRDGSAEDWRAFTDWLEADAAHPAAWDRVALMDDALGALPPRHARPVAAAPAPMRGGDTPVWARAPRRRWAIGGAVAAALAGVLAVQSLNSPAMDMIETRPGERRSVTLADGSRVDLNGGTRIMLDRGNARFARLERGEALFTIVHDARRPFEVRAGDAVLHDLGTVFDVVREPDRLRVAVAEGAVLYNPAGERVRLDPGMGLNETGDRVTVTALDPASVGGWRAGRLSYNAAPLATVAADLGRSIGVPVRAAPAVAARPFTGVIVLDPDRDLLFRRVAALLGVRAVRSAEGWTLVQGEPR